MNNKNCFDFLRFFFASNILLSHLGGLSQNRDLEFLCDFFNSTISVQGFFVISGFLVAKSYVNTPSLKEYFIKRAKRILPAYIFVVTVVALSLAFFSRYTIAEYFSDTGVYKYLGWNYIFLNFVHPCLPGLFENNMLCSVNGALWTLKVEEGFYIVLPFIFYLIYKIKKPFAVLLCLYILSVLYWFVMDLYFHKPVLARQLPGYIAYFATGIFIYLNFDFVISNKMKLFFAAISLLTVSHFSSFQIDIFYPAAFGTLVLISAYSLHFLNNFGKYGDFTYGLYIYHFPIIQLFRQYDLFEKYNPILMAACIISLTFLFAVFSWFFIEKRFLDRYKKNYVQPIVIYAS